MDFTEKQVISIINHMSSAQKQAIANKIHLIQREKHRKLVRSARNKRYYQRHKDKILAKQKIKNAIYNKFVQSA